MEHETIAYKPKELNEKLSVVVAGLQYNKNIGFSKNL